MMFAVWSEGFAATGERGCASLLGYASGDTFKEACASKFKDDHYYNPVNGTYWGCGLFDNEDDARKAFG